VLAEAYNTPYQGKAADDFIQHLKDMDASFTFRGKLLFAKAASVVQTSGTGKSRMLTEVRSLNASFVFVFGDYLPLGRKERFHTTNLSP
jgi:hypothetical protein